MSYEDAPAISDLRKIDIELWSEGKPYPSELAKKLELTRQARKAADNPWTKMIIAAKANLRKEIASSPQLVEDFEFFLDKMGWHPEQLLHDLYFYCNMMHATPQAVIATEKREIWPMGRKSLDALCRNILALATRLEKLNQTKFSPARGVVLRADTGDRLPPARERHLLKAFSELPKILRFYREELNRTVLNAAGDWSDAQKHGKSLVEGAREHSLYERIRAKAGKYHAVRLHRLVNAARQIQNLSPIEWYAFRKWLSELKQRLEKARPQLPH